MRRTSEDYHRSFRQVLRNLVSSVDQGEEEIERVALWPVNDQEICASLVLKVQDVPDVSA